ncbi:hypothetical protein H261_17483 [Paramagnetospirillum caucaseum]|uniref:N-acetyltransferase domain-containing protein n=1 Tax=Paramagnetospirillum caucaseum TaxID=1244869 RepID=M3A814_9PROT|nr:GNAT family N-acetyltransferase [Paramagnetospirillum caucaseum]EME68614.1 hypothetical protein H261_17483 [Paramagnetospirillum caucaseum]
MCQALAEILNTDTKLASALGYAPSKPPLTAGQFMAQTATWCKAHDAVAFAVTVGDGRALGLLSISRLNDPDRRGRLGYWLASEHWGKGIMRDVFTHCLAIAKSHGLRSISGRIPVGNVASERLWLRHGAVEAPANEGQDFSLAGISEIWGCISLCLALARFGGSLYRPLRPSFLRRGHSPL